MVAVRKDYAALTGLEFCLGCGSTKMPRLRRSESLNGVFHACELAYRAKLLPAIPL